jgi:Nuclease-related domain
MAADQHRAAGAWVTEQSRRATVRVWILLGVFGASLVGGSIAAQLGWLSSRQGAAAGLALSALALLAFQAAEQRSRQAIAWLRGSRAERAVGEELERLREHGALVVHDLTVGKGNIDHVVVLPRGVYLVETKARRYEEQHLKVVKRRAHVLHRELGQWVTPVICLATRVDRPYRREGVWIMGREHVVEWLRGRRGRPIALDRVGAVLEELASSRA